MVGGVGEAGLALLPPALGALRGVPRGMPRQPNSPPPRDVWSKENLNRGRDRVYDAEKTGVRELDDLVDQANEAQRRSGGRPTPKSAGELRDLEKEFRSSLGPMERLVYESRRIAPSVPDQIGPGALALHGANVAANDWLWGLGIMPWSWNAPGTLQNDVRRLFSGTPLPTGPEVSPQTAERNRANMERDVEVRTRYGRHDDAANAFIFGKQARDAMAARSLEKTPMSYPDDDQSWPPAFGWDRNKQLPWRTR